MSIEEKVNVADVNDVVSYYEALTDILRDYKNGNIDHEGASSQLMALNLKSDELGLGCMVSNSVLYPIQAEQEEEDSYSNSSYNDDHSY